MVRIIGDVEVDNVNSNLMNVYNVEKYTGTDNVKIEAAIDEAGSANGGTIFFPNRGSDYTLTADVNINRSDLTFLGDAGVTIDTGAYQFTTSTKPSETLFTLSTTINPTTGSTVEVPSGASAFSAGDYLWVERSAVTEVVDIPDDTHFEIRWPVRCSTTSGTNHVGVISADDYVKNIKFKNIVFDGTDVAVFMQCCINGTVEGCEFQNGANVASYYSIGTNVIRCYNNGGTGQYTFYRDRGTSIIDCDFRDNTSGGRNFNFSYNDGLKMRGCYVEQLANTECIIISSGGGHIISDNVFYSKATTDSIILASSSASVQGQGMTIANNHFSGGNQAIELTQWNRVMITGNTSINAVSEAILVTDSDYTTAIGNRLIGGMTDNGGNNGLIDANNQTN